jgi:hypothetical protein
LDEISICVCLKLVGALLGGGENKKCSNYSKILKKNTKSLKSEKKNVTRKTHKIHKTILKTKINLQKFIKINIFRKIENMLKT